jgi:hypothetical protein
LTASASDPTSHARLYIGLVTPHSAALSASENERIVELFVANLRRYLDGEPLVNVVEPGVLHEKYLGAPGDILLPSSHALPRSLVLDAVAGARRGGAVAHSAAAPHRRRPGSLARRR